MAKMLTNTNSPVERINKSQKIARTQVNTSVYKYVQCAQYSNIFHRMRAQLIKTRVLKQWETLGIHWCKKCKLKCMLIKRICKFFRFSALSDDRKKEQNKPK